MSLLEVENLRTYFYTEDGIVQAIDGVDFEVKSGETIGLVGESGAGKSVTVESILGLIRPPGKTVEGTIRFNGQDLHELTEKELRRTIRGTEISVVFQDPMSALNPVFTIGSQVSEIIEYHQDISEQAAKERTIELLDDVGIPDPAQRAEQYPHEFSGGMRQRVLIAMALSCNPKLIIADEPTTALDVTIQAQILDLFNEIQEEYDTSIIYVTHDLGVAREVCDRIAVMYLGKIVETARYEELYRNPKHPYTQLLMRSVVTPEKGDRTLDPIEGTMPSGIDPPSGCRFRTRCPVAVDDCSRIDPPLYDTNHTHDVACIRYDERYGKDEPQLHQQIDAERGETRMGTETGTRDGGVE
jgi:oligopeptide/dipeptide ABC transporter ATP-binding protein